MAAQASRHVCVIVAFIFIGFVLSRADAISDSEVVQFQKFVASHQNQPAVMKCFWVASQLSANWTNTVILLDYDRIDILINAESGDDKCAWSVFDTGTFRHVVNDTRCVVGCTRFISTVQHFSKGGVRRFWQTTKIHVRRDRYSADAERHG